MSRSILMITAPLLRPDNRFRKQCLLMLTMLAGGLLYLSANPGAWPTLAYLPREELVHAFALAALAGLSWVVLGGRSPAGTVVVAGSFALLDEALRQSVSGRTAGLHEVFFDLVGAALVVLALGTLRFASTRQANPARFPSGVRSGTGTVTSPGAGAGAGSGVGAGLGAGFGAGLGASIGAGSVMGVGDSEGEGEAAAL